MKLVHALLGGAAGALAVTILNEVGKRAIPEAPKLDSLGRQAISKALKSAGQKPPSGDALQRMALAGDLVSNTLYYSLVGLGGDDNSIWVRGPLLGLAAGLGAAVLPERMGLSDKPVRRTPLTTALTLLWYTQGGAAAAAVYRALRKSA